MEGRVFFERADDTASTRSDRTGTRARAIRKNPPAPTTAQRSSVLLSPKTGAVSPHHIVAAAGAAIDAAVPDEVIDELVGILSRLERAAAGAPPNAAAAPGDRTCRRGAAGIIIQRPIQRVVMPEARPPDWPYCNTACIQNSTYDMHVKPQDGIFVQVVHKPIPGITPAMMVHWFSGAIEGEPVTFPDGRRFSRYLTWHPKDHIHEITTRQRNKTGGVAGNVREIS